MLDKLVVHLKNVLFFKTVIYFLITVGISVLIPIFKADLIKTNAKYEQTLKYLSQASLKLSSATDFENKILTANKKYAKTIKEADHYRGCAERKSLIRSIEAISRDTVLSEPINVEISKLLDNRKETTIGKASLDTYVLNVNFTTPNIHSFLQLSNKILQLLPRGASVVSINIDSFEALSPDMVKNLSPSKPVNLLQAHFEIYLRELAYEK